MKGLKRPVAGRTKQEQQLKTQGLMKNIEQRKKNLKPSSESRNSKRNILISAFRNKNRNVSLKKINEIINANKSILNFKVTEVNKAVNKLKNEMNRQKPKLEIIEENVPIGFSEPIGNYPPITVAHKVNSNDEEPVPVAQPARFGNIAATAVAYRRFLRMPGQVMINTAKKMFKTSRSTEAKTLLSGILRNMNAGKRMRLTDNDRKYLEDYRAFIQTTENSKIFTNKFNKARNPTEKQLNVMRNIMNKKLNKFLTPEEKSTFTTKLLQNKISFSTVASGPITMRYKAVVNHHNKLSAQQIKQLLQVKRNESGRITSLNNSGIKMVEPNTIKNIESIIKTRNDLELTFLNGFKNVRDQKRAREHKQAIKNNIKKRTEKLEKLRKETGSKVNSIRGVSKK